MSRMQARELAKQTSLDSNPYFANTVPFLGTISKSAQGMPRIHTVESRIRHVLLHYHIFKNSGSSIDAILEANFGYKMAYLHGRTSASLVTNRDLLSFLHSNPDIQVVSSHHLRPKKPLSDLLFFFDIIFVRHPLDRLRSMYEFYRRSGETRDPLVQEAHSHSMASFMDLLLRYHPHLVNNAQVNFLANKGCCARPVDARDLDIASAIVCGAAVPGVSEMFDLSINLAKYFLYPTFGAIEASVAAVNVCPDRSPELDVRLEAMRQACGSIIYDALLAANQLDLHLVDRVRAELKRRSNSLPAVAHPLELAQFQ